MTTKPLPQATPIGALSDFLLPKTRTPAPKSPPPYKNRVNLALGAKATWGGGKAGRLSLK